MSLLNPAANTTEATTSPLLGLRGTNVAMFISTAIMAIGLTRLYGIGDSGEFNNFFATALAWEFGFPALAAVALMRQRRR